MTMSAITDNAAWAAARPLLSVLIPFKGDDPVRLLASLDGPGSAVEILVLDDGGGDDALAARVAAMVGGLARPARFIRLPVNRGRSAARNRLALDARGRRMLFLDSDMAPDSPTFLENWLAFADRRDPAVAFGGFSLDRTPVSAIHALHRAMALKSDCAGAKRRRLTPEKSLFTSNLLVRRDVFLSERFDEAFAGWGWEDVEWAMRVGRRYRIEHIDNTASHLGLDSAGVLAAKYEQSVANFARVARAHHDIVRAYPSYRAARALRRAPLRRYWRPMLKSAALAEQAPVSWRALAMRAYRAALYADVV